MRSIDGPMAQILEGWEKAGDNREENRSASCRTNKTINPVGDHPMQIRTFGLLLLMPVLLTFRLSADRRNLRKIEIAIPTKVFALIINRWHSVHL
jgi:hypothetical protein